MKLSALSSQRGLSLLETTIAIFIIMIGLIGGLSLAIYSTTVARDVKERTLAYYLAQEGLELVRNYRDSKWLAELNIFSSIPGPDLSQDNRDYAVDYTGLLDPRGAFATNQASYRLYYNNGFYRHDAGIQTPYTRAIHRLNLGGGDFRIVSKVRWENKEVKLEMHLFNWRDI